MATWRQNGRCGVELHLVRFAHFLNPSHQLMSVLFEKEKITVRKKGGGISRQRGALVQCHRRPFGKK